MQWCQTSHPEEEKDERREVPNSVTRSGQVGGRQFHKRYQLLHLAFQHGHGQEAEWKVENVHGLHRLELSAPQGCVPTPKHWPPGRRAVC